MPFKKGESGNPGGRHKSNLSKMLSDYLMLRDPASKKRHDQVIAERVTAMAESGDLEAIQFIWERLEGKVPTNFAELPSGTTLRELVIG